MTSQSTTSTARIYADEARMLPRVLLRALVALVLSALVLVTLARVTGRPLESTPPVSPVKAEAEIRLVSDGVSGAVKVTGREGALVADLSPEAGGFIAGVHRVILRERTKHRVDPDGPVLLRAGENGRLAIHDPSTGWSADLMGFGADNASAFARLLAQIEKGNSHGTTDKGH